MRILPRYPEAYKNLGNLLKSRDHWRRAAVRAYRVALELNPTSREVFLNLGETLQWLGEDGAANVTYTLAVERGVWEHAQQRPSMCADTLPSIITPCSSDPPPQPDCSGTCVGSRRDRGGRRADCRGFRASSITTRPYATRGSSY